MLVGNVSLIMVYVSPTTRQQKEDYIAGKATMKGRKKVVGMSDMKARCTTRDLQNNPVENGIKYLAKVNGGKDKSKNSPLFV